MEESAVNKYQLAKLVDWTGTLDARKRVQKVAYMLQVAGCPLQADFFLHRYGPYSPEVAQLTDKLVADGVLIELKSENAAGHQFGYQLTQVGKTLLGSFESKSTGKELKRSIAKYKPLAQKLAKSELRDLEIAATIAYFFRTSGDWTRARECACRFKNINPNTRFAKKAEELAQSVTDA
jgi:uncharacterized protein YwgA